MDLETANAPRTLVREGYEAWYLTCHVPGEGIGFWIRYTTFNPGPRPEAEPHAALWAFSFDRKRTFFPYLAPPWDRLAAQGAGSAITPRWRTWCSAWTGRRSKRRPP